MKIPLKKKIFVFVFNISLPFPFTAAFPAFGAWFAVSGVLLEHEYEIVLHLACMGLASVYATIEYFVCGFGREDRLVLVSSLSGGRKKNKKSWVFGRARPMPPGRQGSRMTSLSVDPRPALSGNLPKRDESCRRAADVSVLGVAVSRSLRDAARHAVDNADSRLVSLRGSTGDDVSGWRGACLVS